MLENKTSSMLVAGSNFVALKVVKVSEIKVGEDDAENVFVNPFLLAKSGSWILLILILFVLISNKLIEFHANILFLRILYDFLDDMALVLEKFYLFDCSLFWILVKRHQSKFRFVDICCGKIGFVLPDWIFGRWLLCLQFLWCLFLYPCWLWILYLIHSLYLFLVPYVD